MSDLTSTRSGGQVGSLIISGLFVVAGCVTLYDTLSYTDRDSQVFPQTVAIILIITAAISFVARFLKPASEGGFGHGVWWRRVLLIATMFVTCFLMPVVGFLPASLVAFIGGLIAAMHDRWSVSVVMIYWGAGLVIMATFFVMFKFALHVPLP
jgi:hypothetical protein